MRGNSVDLSGYLDNTDAQTLSIDSTTNTFTISISNGNNISFDNRDADYDITNELQYIDTFEIVSNILRLSVDGTTQPFQSVDLSAYLDNTDNQTIDTF